MLPRLSQHLPLTSPLGSPFRALATTSQALYVIWQVELVAVQLLAMTTSLSSLSKHSNYPSSHLSIMSCTLNSLAITSLLSCISSIHASLHHKEVHQLSASWLPSKQRWLYELVLVDLHMVGPLPSPLLPQ